MKYYSKQLWKEKPNAIYCDIWLRTSDGSGAPLDGVDTAGTALRGLPAHALSILIATAFRRYTVAHSVKSLQLQTSKISNLRKNKWNNWQPCRRWSSRRSRPVPSLAGWHPSTKDRAHWRRGRRDRCPLPPLQPGPSCQFCPSSRRWVCGPPSLWAARDPADGFPVPPLLEQPPSRWQCPNWPDNRREWPRNPVRTCTRHPIASVSPAIYEPAFKNEKTEFKKIKY